MALYKKTDEPGDVLPVTPEGMVQALEDEFQNHFGDIGRYIVRKQVLDLKGDRPAEIKDIPGIIEALSTSSIKIIGANNAKDLRKRLRHRCGLPV